MNTVITAELTDDRRSVGRESESADDTACDKVWHRAADFDFPPGISAEEAWIAALTNGIAHLRSNEACVVGRLHIEGAHQMRVALRRLRSRLGMYAPLLPAVPMVLLDGELKWLIRKLGPARDWDVFVTEVLAPVVKRLPDDADLASLGEAAEAARDQGYDRAQAALGSPRYDGLLAEMNAWIEDRPWRQEALLSRMWAAPALRLAGAVLTARHDAVMARGEQLATMSAEERHRLRIEIKKQRYAVEFFGPLFAPGRVAPYVAALKDLQDNLGVANDLEVARRLVLKLAAAADSRQRLRLALAGGIVVGFHARGAKAETGIEKAWAHFRLRRIFWRRPRQLRTATASPAHRAAG